MPKAYVDSEGNLVKECCRCHEVKPARGHVRHRNHSRTRSI
jgi:hypothetical protein